MDFVSAHKQINCTLISDNITYVFFASLKKQLKTCGCTVCKQQNMSEYAKLINYDKKTLFFTWKY